MPSKPDPVLKAYENLEFLHSDAAREIRILCELTEPKARLRAAQIERTIVFFGSSRTPAPEASAQAISSAEAALKASPKDPVKKQALDRAIALGRGSEIYDTSRTLARLLAEWSEQIAEPRKRYTICTGAGPGMMTAVNHGAQQGGAKSMGLSISLPFEQGHNAYIDPEHVYEFHYFMIRKYWFAKKAKAMVVCPGGFGTMDELFEFLTLMQTRKLGPPLPTILMGRAFWDAVINFQAFADWGMISPEDLDLFRIEDDPQAAFDWLTQELIRLNP
jgi:uncharacterized protein (TIGR00730 family)